MNFTTHEKIKLCYLDVPEQPAHPSFNFEDFKEQVLHYRDSDNNPILDEEFINEYGRYLFNYGLFENSKYYEQFSNLHNHENEVNLLSNLFYLKEKCEKKQFAITFNIDKVKVEIKEDILNIDDANKQLLSLIEIIQNKIFITEVDPNNDFGIKKEIINFKYLEKYKSILKKFPRTQDKERIMQNRRIIFNLSCFLRIDEFFKDFEKTRIKDIKFKYSNSIFIYEYLNFFNMYSYTKYEKNNDKNDSISSIIKNMFSEKNDTDFRLMEFNLKAGVYQKYIRYRAS